jgi:DNA-binding NtrC family response regulator
MRDLFSEVTDAAMSDEPVFVLGDCRSARAAVARRVHNASSRSKGAFIELDACEAAHVGRLRAICHQPGSQTVEVAPHGGTLYLDNVELLSGEDQEALLRTIQGGANGSANHQNRPQVRWIAASGEEMATLVRQGRWLESLYGRLSLHRLSLPTLAESAAQSSTEPRTNDDLRGLAEKPMSMDDLERYAIEAALRRTRGNVTRAMRQLGIGRTTLYRKLKKYGLR